MYNTFRDGSACSETGGSAYNEMGGSIWTDIFILEGSIKKNKKAVLRKSILI